MLRPLAWLSRSGSGYYRPRSRRNHRSFGAAVPCLESLEERVLLSAPSLTNLDIAEVAQGFCSEKYIQGEISDSARPNYGDYEITVDWDSDGNADAFASYDPDAETFAYKLPDFLQSGTVTFDIRWWGNELVFEGDGASINVDPGPPANNTAPEITQAAISWIDPVPGDGAFSFEFRDYTHCSSRYKIELDSNSDGDMDDYDDTSWYVAGPMSDGIYVYAENPQMRVTEYVQIDGVDVQIAQTDWKSLDIGGIDPNQAPIFDPNGDYTHTIGYGNVGDGDGAGSAVASDPDGTGTSLKYAVVVPRPAGFGSDGRFYAALPTNGVSIDANGNLSIADPEAIKNSFDLYGKYSFTVLADDGIATSSVGYTIYDNWQWWANKTTDLLSLWKTKYGEAILLTESRTQVAIQNLDAFAELDHIAEVAGGLSSILWATAPSWPLAGAAATAATTAVGHAIKEYNDAQTGLLTDFIQAATEEVTANSLDARDALYIAKTTELTNKKDDWADPGDAAAKALEARAYFTNLVVDFNFDPYALVESVPDDDTIAAPSSRDIYGGLLEDFADGQGFVVYRGAGEWKCSDSTDYPFIMDGQDVADELNRIGYW